MEASVQICVSDNIKLFLRGENVVPTFSNRHPHCWQKLREALGEDLAVTSTCVQYRGRSYVVGPRHLPVEGFLPHPYIDIAILPPEPGHHYNCVKISDEGRPVQVGDLVFGSGFAVDALHMVMSPVRSIGTRLPFVLNYTDIQDCDPRQCQLPHPSRVRVVLSEAPNLGGMSGLLLYHVDGVAGVSFGMQEFVPHQTLTLSAHADHLFELLQCSQADHLQVPEGQYTVFERHGAVVVVPSLESVSLELPHDHASSKATGAAATTGDV